MLNSHMLNKAKEIITISLIALFILGQLYLIKRIVSTVEENIKLKYSGIAQEAVNNLVYTTDHQGLDKVIASYDSLSKKYLIALATVPDDLEEWVKNEARKEFTTQLEQQEEISEAIKKYFLQNELKDGYSHQIKIESLILQPFGETNFILFPDSKEDTLKTEGIKVNTFYYESGRYTIKVGTYIKLDDKYEIILRESSTIILISLLCIGIVLSFYIITLFNLKKEKRLSNMKTDFMNNLMHELKTPLATISIAGKNLEIEEVQNQKEKISAIASTIERQNQHLKKLINHIVDISMWEKKQFQIEKVECNLNEFLKETVQAFKSGNTKNVEIIEDYAQNLPLAYIDVFHFTTLITNLLSNAVKYNEEPVKIVIKTEHKDSFEVSIADNGIGISSVDQKHLFDKFYRVGHGNIYKSKGLGLGLYFASKIIEAHKGEIKIESKKGKGSKFTLIF